MFKPKVVLLTASLFLISGITVTKVVQAQNNQNNLQTSTSRKKTETELISIAETALKTENDILVNGNIENALSRNPLALRAREAFKKRFETILERRKFLTARKIGFRGFQTQLEVKKIQIDGDMATLEATEKTVRNYDLSIMPPDTPNTTASYTDHLFTFVLRNGQWDLSSNQLLNVPSPPTKPDEKSVPVDPSVTPADPLAPPTDVKSNLASQQVASAWKSIFNIFKSFSKQKLAKV
ncbi:hypothetical protein NIES4103_50770 [Nostoc sp. NIES-4103]|nr:hypothetical protein NIES4103_50770 [Nostoc sp. NIES-4103]